MSIQYVVVHIFSVVFNSIVVKTRNLKQMSPFMQVSAFLQESAGVTTSTVLHFNISDRKVFFQ